MAVVHRAAVHPADAGEVPARPDLPAPCEDSACPPVHSSANHLLRRHHGRQRDHHHIACLPAHGQRSVL